MNKTETRDNKILLRSVIYAFAGCIGCMGIMANEKELPYTNSFFAFMLFGLGVFVMSKILPGFCSASKREKTYAYIFAALLSLALHMGAMLETADNVDFKNIIFYIGVLCLTVFLAPVAHSLWNSYFKTGNRSVHKEEEKPLRFTSVWLIIFLLWIPVFMAFYPGAFVYDATDEYVEVISRTFTMHHPLLHVLLLGGLVHLGEYTGLGANAGIAAYTLMQMVVMSGIFAYVIISIQKYVKKKYLLGIIVAIGVFPIFPMYAVCSAKDTLFSGAFLLVVVLLVQFGKSADEFVKNKMVLFVAASVMMMLLRNNGLYAYIVAIPFMALCYRTAGFDKKKWGKLVILMILSVVLYKGADYCLKIATDASDNEHQEMLTVPIQQLARVYHYYPDAFSPDEKATLYEVLPENYLGTYNPRCSDILKSGFDNKAYDSNPSKYRRLWLKMGLRKPLVYVNGWLVNSYGYWYPDMIINVYGGNQMRTFQYKDSSYFGFETETPGDRNSLFPLLEELYRNMSLELFQQKVPVISMLFAPGFVFIVFAWFFMGLMRQKKWKYLAAYIPVLLLWGTVLLGPTVLVRYVLILWFIIPMMVDCNVTED